jgi:phosphoribosylformimino-5-aminoimidazole carboxamide ribotide isomerase
MIILPAIDLRGGRCVRLRQGRFDDETVFDEDPVGVAKRFEAVFEAAGAPPQEQWLHVVDLDGARTGQPAHLDVVRQIAAAVGMHVELGGGVRTRDYAESALAAGVERVIVGTRAVEDPEWLRALADALPGRIVLGLDARGGRVAVEGWESETSRSAAEVVAWFRDDPLAAIIYTDIARDGMMRGPNVDATAAVASGSPFPVIGSGGVTTEEDVVRLRDAGCAGAIIGRALYEGKLTLAGALAAAAAKT